MRKQYGNMSASSPNTMLDGLEREDLLQLQESVNASVNRLGTGQCRKLSTTDKEKINEAMANISRVLKKWQQRPLVIPTPKTNLDHIWNTDLLDEIRNMHAKIATVILDRNQDDMENLQYEIAPHMSDAKKACNLPQRFADIHGAQQQCWKPHSETQRDHWRELGM